MEEETISMEEQQEIDLLVEQQTKDLEITEKSKKLQIESLKKDAENKTQELDDFKFNIEVLKENKELKEQELVLRLESGKIMVKNYKKLKPDFAWEGLPEYEKCMCELQKVMDKNTKLNIQGELRAIEKRLKSSEGQFESLKTSLVMVEDEIKNLEQE